jgi:hypothetical protein
VAAVPVWAWLCFLLAVSIVIRIALALRDPAPWIFQDELLYSELAKSFGTTGHFAVRESPYDGGFGIVYPLLISPAWALFLKVPTAYAAAKAINAVMMSLAAVPVYLLARRLVAPAYAFVAALLTLAIPSMVFTSTIMTENAFYPVFLFWVLATVLALECPTVLRQLAAVGLVLVVFLTRTQGGVLLPALVTSIVLVIVLDAWADDRPFRAVVVQRAAAFWVTWVTLIVGVVLFVVVQVVIRGKTMSSAILGGYSTLSESSYSARAVSRWFLYHLAELDLAVGVIPFAAFLLLLAVALRPSCGWRQARVFAVVAFSATIWLVLEVAAFASTAFGQQIQERNVFYLMPLFLIALAAWLGRGLERPWPLAAVAGVVAAALPGVLPFGSLLGAGNVLANAVGLVPLIRLEQVLVAPDRLPAFVMIGAVVAASVFLALPRRLSLLAPALVVAYFSLATGAIVGQTTLASRSSRLASTSLKRDWIDRAIGTRPDVAAVWSNDREFVSLWDNEFFNRSVGPVYNFYGPPDGLPQETVAPNLKTGVLLDPEGKPVRAQYALVATTIPIMNAHLIAADRAIGLALYKVDGPIRTAGSLTGVYRDAWSGSTVEYSGVICSKGTLTVRLTGDPVLQPKPQTVVATNGTRELGRIVVRPRRFNVPFTVMVPERGEDGRCHVTFRVSPTAVPAQVLGTPDTRELGIRFENIAYRPSG